MRERTKISVMIVDDEPLARHGLRSLLEEEHDLTIVAEAGDGEEALRLIAAHAPDVVFLDIQMPETDGFDVIRSLPKKKIPLIVFVTAYDQFAVQAFASHALDYILKPFDADRVRIALHRIREMVRLKTGAAYSETILEALSVLRPQGNYIERITVRNAGKISFVSVHDILWIEAAADYIIIHSRTGKHTTREMLGVIEKYLDPSRFIRIHRSVIVNVEAVRELQPQHHGEYSMLLTEGTILTVSRTYKNRIAPLIT